MAALARAPGLRELWLVGNPCNRVCVHTCGEALGGCGPWCPATSTDAAASAAVRAYVAGRLPCLACLDGVPIRPSERAAAVADLPRLDAALAAVEVAAGRLPAGLPPQPPPPPPPSPGALSVADSASSGYDAAEAAALEAEVDALLAEREAEEEEAGKRGGGDAGEEAAPLPADGPPTAWTRLARLAEVRAKERAAAARAAKQDAASGEASTGPLLPRPGRHTGFPPAPPDGGAGAAGPPTASPTRQVNEGGWAYTLTPGEVGSPAAGCIVLDLRLGRGVPPGDVRVDVTPRAVRVLVAARSGGGGGSGGGGLAVPPPPPPSAATTLPPAPAHPPSFLLQLALPGRVCPPISRAARSRASGALVVTMPLVDPAADLDPACVREAKQGQGTGGGSAAAVGSGGGGPAGRTSAAVVAVDAGDEHDAPPPPLAG